MSLAKRPVWLVLAAMLVAAPISGRADDKDKVFQQQKHIFQKISKATDAKTFEGAKVLLDQIKPAEIDDTDLAFCYSYAKEVADFCVDLDIPRDSKIEYAEIITKLDYTAILARLVDKGVTNAPAEATRLVSKALKIKRKIPRYEETFHTLQARYDRK